MPTTTYTPIASVTLSASASEIVFSGLPQTFRDLIVIASLSYSNGDALRYRLNGDTGSNYSYVRMWGENSSGFSSATTATFGYLGDLPGSGTRVGMSRLQLMDYSATDKHKSGLSIHTYDPTAVSYNAFTTANRWANTAAVTSISIFSPNANAFQSGSTFNLFGVIS